MGVKNEGGQKLGVSSERTFRMTPFEIEWNRFLLLTSFSLRKNITSSISENVYHIRTLVVQFLIFKPLSYCFEETIRLDIKASFTSWSVPLLIR